MIGGLIESKKDKAIIFQYYFGLDTDNARV
jgi:hypothetical protein